MRFYYLNNIEEKSKKLTKFLVILTFLVIISFLCICIAFWLTYEGGKCDDSKFFFESMLIVYAVVASYSTCLIFIALVILGKSLNMACRKLRKFQKEKKQYKNTQMRLINLSISKFTIHASLVLILVAFTIGRLI